MSNLVCANCGKDDNPHEYSRFICVTPESEPVCWNCFLNTVQPYPAPIEVFSFDADSDPAYFVMEPFDRWADGELIYTDTDAYSPPINGVAYDDYDRTAAMSNVTAKRLQHAYNFIDGIHEDQLVQRSLKEILTQALKYVLVVQEHAQSEANYFDEETLDEEGHGQEWQQEADDAEAFGAELKLLLGVSDAH